MRMRKNWHNPRCLLRCTCTYYFFYLKKNGTLEQLCHIIKSKIVKGEKSHHFPFRNDLYLSQWSNPSPSVVNPIFPVYKKARHCFYFSVSTTYITRLRGIVNACDPIVSTGLSESILKNKKETSRQKK